MNETSRSAVAVFLLAALHAAVLPAGALPAERGTNDLAPVLREDSDESGRVQRCRPGPWGEIEYLNIVIEAPESALPEDPAPVPQPAWHFAVQEPDALRAALAGAGLTEAQADSMLRTAATNESAPGIFVLPSEELILALEPAPRARLYRLLATSPLNASFRWPYRFEDADPGPWFAEADLSPSTRALLARLVYRRDDLWLFSDLPAILARIPAAPERRALLRALGRQSTVLPRLYVRPDDNLDLLVSYWGGPGREDAVRPLLESLHRSPSGWTIGITSLLPPLPREQLYTFDSPNGHGYHDCHWTSMNFFNREPDERFREPAFVKQTILDHYRVVTADYRLGDLILLRDTRGEVVHSCNYIADNLVYSKNGGEQSQPWVIMTLDDLLRYYAVSTPLSPVFLRMRD